MSTFETMPWQLVIANSPAWGSANGAHKDWIAFEEAYAAAHPLTYTEKGFHKMLDNPISRGGVFVGTRIQECGWGGIYEDETGLFFFKVEKNGDINWLYSSSECYTPRSFYAVITDSIIYDGIFSCLKYDLPHVPPKISLESMTSYLEGFESFQKEDLRTLHQNAPQNAQGEALKFVSMQIATNMKIMREHLSELADAVANYYVEHLDSSEEELAELQNFTKRLLLAINKCNNY